MSNDQSRSDREEKRSHSVGNTQTSSPLLFFSVVTDRNCFYLLNNAWLSTDTYFLFSSVMEFLNETAKHEKLLPEGFLL